jgi:hypothetical protein
MKKHFWVLHTIIPAGTVYGRSPMMDMLPDVLAHNHRLLEKVIEWEWSRRFLELLLR